MLTCAYCDEIAVTTLPSPEWDGAPVPVVIPVCAKHAAKPGVRS